MPETFATGDRVRAIKVLPGGDLLSADQTYVVGTVQPLNQPADWYVNPCYWDKSGWEWAREKTRLDIAGHPQVIFLDDVLRPRMDIPPLNEDPEGKGRASFSGVWFEKVA